MKTLHKSALSLPVLLWLLCLTPACTRFAPPFIPQGKGGTYLIINVKSDPAQLDQTMAQTIAVIEKRCELLVIRCELERLSGDQASRIKLRTSSSMDPERIKRILLSQGEELELRAVVSPPVPSPVKRYPTQKEAAAAAGQDKDVMPYLENDAGSEGSTKSFVVVERTPIVTGQDIRQAEAVPSYDQEHYRIDFKLNPAGANRFGEWTGANVNNYLAVVLNKEVRSVAYIKSQIFDSGQITGRFTKQQAEDTAMLLRSGSLPASVEAVEEGTDKP
ncbi:MAG TPA: hypothetical protein VGN95_04625 [Pyrinomonadaceae bacterium]|jgi:preprotein translocase subunit SecD|nr:hypothetical protein [Pyrinomonadaceae bacterium]